ncbi:hypothetical protein SEVIR_9G535400v4 [Setaria viridis]|uniref:Uncharacterized protein n=1 Tax=Setaria viridis TaxID=4556 RepID=A0A4U6TKZ5_SETVI|nr:hypothetical protein SEVIR_9G535400v2 [Setaria viridis]
MTPALRGLSFIPTRRRRSPAARALLLPISRAELPFLPAGGSASLLRRHLLTGVAAESDGGQIEEGRPRGGRNPELGSMEVNPLLQIHGNRKMEGLRRYKAREGVRLEKRWKAVGCKFFIILVWPFILILQFIV